MKIVLFILSLSFPLLLNAEEPKDYDLKINIKRFLLVINGSSYSDASGVNVELKGKENSRILICADHDALHSQVVEVMDELRKLGISNMRFGADNDCK